MDDVMFSVIIPVYNARMFINQCVESVICQTYRNFEIILVDDGSTDGSYEICNQWSETDSRIHMIHQINEGAASARNIAIKNASGKYLLFLDADDWWKSEYVLAAIAERIDWFEADILSFNFQKEYQGVLASPYFNVNTKSLIEDETSSFQYIFENDLWISSPCNKAIRREFVNENLIFFRKGIRSEDIDWCLRLALHANSFDYLNIVVFIYRQHVNSTSHQNSEIATQQLLCNIQECVYQLENHEKEIPMKVEKLWSYVAYQYGTLLYSIAGLNRFNKKETILMETEKLKYLLSYGRNMKVRLLNYAVRLLGINGAICLLRMMRLMKK